MVARATGRGLTRGQQWTLCPTQVWPWLELSASSWELLTLSTSQTGHAGPSSWGAAGLSLPAQASPNSAPSTPHLTATVLSTH